MSEVRETYVLTRTDHTIIKNTPEETHSLHLCKEHGVYAVRHEKESKNCIFCGKPGLFEISREMYWKEVNNPTL